MDNIYVVKETTLTVEKKPLVLVLPYLRSISLQTRTKLKKSLKTSLIVLNCKQCLRIKLDQATTFISKIRSKIFLLVSFIKFRVGSAMSAIMVKFRRHLNVRIGEHIVISPLLRKQVKPKNRSVVDHLLLCNQLASYDDFSILSARTESFYQN